MGETFYEKSFQVIESNVSLEDTRYLEHRKEWDYYTKTLELKDVPLHVDIEVTNACNLRCAMCERNTMKRKVGLMEYSLFCHIIDQCVEIGVCSVKLNLWGESLVHPQFFEMIDYARKNKIYTQFNTNANFLTEAIIQKLIACGLDRVTISLESINKELYEGTRIGNKYEKVMQNIEKFIALKPVGKKPYITVQCIQMKRNIGHIQSFIDSYKGRVDFISVTNIESVTGDRRILADSLIDYSKLPKQPCDQLWQRLSIYWNGDVTLCCADSDGFLTIGNLKEKSLREWWHSEELNRIREKHKRLDFSGLICEKCTNTCRIPKKDSQEAQEKDIFLKV